MTLQAGSGQRITAPGIEASVGGRAKAGLPAPSYLLGMEHTLLISANSRPTAASTRQARDVFAGTTLAAFRILLFSDAIETEITRSIYVNGYAVKNEQSRLLASSQVVATLQVRIIEKALRYCIGRVELITSIHCN